MGSSVPDEASSNAPNVVIFGCGAIGGLTAAYLNRAGTPFTLVDPWFQNVETIKRSGLQVTRLSDRFTTKPTVLHVDQIDRLARPIDVLVVAVKSYDTEWVTRLAAPYLAPGAVAISAQNGLNEGRITTILGSERVVGCVVRMSGFLERPGEVLGTTPLTRGAFVLGEMDGSSSMRVDQLAALLTPVGGVSIHQDIKSSLWAKLLLNVMLNALAGITGMSTPALWGDSRMVALMIRLGGEAVLVAERLGQVVESLTPPGMPNGFRLLPADIKAAHLGDEAAAGEVAKCFGAMAAGRAGGGEEGKASLLQDLIRGRRTEIDYLNGYIVSCGLTTGIDTTMNRAVTDIVHDLEFHHREPTPTGADPLLRML